MYSALSGPTDWILRYIKTTLPFLPLQLCESIQRVGGWRKVSIRPSALSRITDRPWFSKVSMTATLTRAPLYTIIASSKIVN